jgi:hypothetical protein
VEQQKLLAAGSMSSLSAPVRNQLTGSQGIDNNELDGQIDWRNPKT